MFLSMCGARRRVIAKKDWPKAGSGLVIGGTAWVTSNFGTGYAASREGMPGGTGMGLSGSVWPEKAGSGLQGYRYGKLQPAEWGTN